MATEKKLLYIKVAAPKTPKRRSRAGELSISIGRGPALFINAGKDKKKKCDEVRPSCTRCQEQGEVCHYEPVQPRQRRKELARCRRSSDDEIDEIPGLDSSPSSTEATMHASDQTPSTLDTATSFPEWDTPDLSTIHNLDDDCRCLGDISADGFGTYGRIYLLQTSQTPASCTIPCLSLIGPTGSPPSHILELHSPSFVDFTHDPNERFLMHYFCNTLSHLIVLREDRGNPFQQLVLPLAYTSPAVKAAIYALASAHLVGKAQNRLASDETSIHFHNEAIRNLATLIAKGDGVDGNELLATIMLIVYYEVLVQRRRSNLVESHLKGAMAIMRTNSTRGDPTTTFLEEAFRFYDVIAALSSGTAPLSSDSYSNELPSVENYTITNTRHESPPRARSEQPLPTTDGPNALLGLATSLWPVIHRLSGLLSLKNKVQDALYRGDSDMFSIAATQGLFDTECASIETCLHEWQPVLPTPEDATTTAGTMKELQSIFNNALAYRHSALVYLYRTIYNFSRTHPAVQHHASVSLVHCRATVLHEGPMGALLWPLFVASCEAVDPVDRHSARETFQGIAHRQGMANIERAWEVVQEVWRRADKADGGAGVLQQAPSLGGGVGSSRLDVCRRFGGQGEEEEEEKEEEEEEEEEEDMGRCDVWRRVSEDMGVAIVFG
ncbi:hypothetical protein E4U60_005088 [Claviceps pazoutovae]|uniref:Zn(2)-C6 fungal-type domain-containing protein n=1 Tax=Claviceps pazoutovae TaxID=1649127 RepID=A0A9P7SED3_9HYPO|nr:hypothetical protein E4U60_005088 [Claviceps pazoutovae]